MNSHSIHPIMTNMPPSPTPPRLPSPATAAAARAAAAHHRLPRFHSPVAPPPPAYRKLRHLNLLVLVLRFTAFCFSLASAVFMAANSSRSSGSPSWLDFEVFRLMVAANGIVALYSLLEIGAAVWEFLRGTTPLPESVQLWFDFTHDQVHDTENANLKEKFEGDLKKEIKKLQRHRDQIKTWQQSSEIKDKKVGPSYEQALMDSRKLIEREMERFKVFEKETKTKAFSKEGLGQQPKTDPKEKARSETRDWLNNVVGDLESQIDNFEAELEGISVKKGKTRNPQLTHLETSIARHKAHIMKLELILRLLDNDELSPDEINEIKYLLDEYVECNQVNFDQYSDIDELYATLPLDKVEALEDLVIQGSSGIVKAALLSSAPQNADQAQSDEITYQESNLETVLKPASPEAGATVPTVPSSVPEGPSLATISNASVHTLLEGPACPAVLSDPASIQSVPAESADSATSSIPNQSNAVEDINSSFPACSASIIADVAPEKCISREISNQDPVSVPLSLTSVGAISSNGGLDSVPVVSDLSKNFFSRVDERMIGGITPSVSSPLSTRVLLQQGLRINDGTNSNDTHKVGEDLAIGGRVFPHSVGSTEWSPQTAAAFKNQNEGQIRTRPEISPDQREKYLQRLQQVQQQGHTTLLSVPNLPAANHKQLLMQQENSILQQLNSQSVPPQLGLALNVQSSALSSVSNAQLQFPIHQLSSQNLQISAGAKDLDTCHSKREELQQQQSFFGDKNAETFMNSGFTKIMSDDNLSTPLMIGGSSIMTGGNQLTRENDLLPGQLRQYSQPSANHGVIGRNVSNHYTSGDKLRGSVGNFGGYDPAYNLQLLEAALHHLPQPKDSEFVKSYVPRHPATTPASFPQTQAEIINNPAFWKRLGLDEWGTDTLFFAFYHQQNTYQQYLAARELKRNSWRYHNQYNTWFQRHKEPEDATDDYETGTYVYYDFHIQDGSPQQGWCQRIKTNFTFEYKYLEDELVV